MNIYMLYVVFNLFNKETVYDTLLGSKQNYIKRITGTAFEEVQSHVLSISVFHSSIQIIICCTDRKLNSQCFEDTI